MDILSIKPECVVVSDKKRGDSMVRCRAKQAAKRRALRKLNKKKKK